MRHQFHLIDMVFFGNYLYTSNVRREKCCQRERVKKNKKKHRQQSCNSEWIRMYDKKKSGV